MLYPTSLDIDAKPWDSIHTHADTSLGKLVYLHTLVLVQAPESLR